MQYIYFTRRVLVYILGLFTMASGINLCRASRLGGAPASTLPSVISQAVEDDMGLWTFLVFMVFLFIQILLYGRSFEKKNLFQVFSSLIFGFFVSFAAYMTDPIVPEGYHMQLLTLAGGIFGIALGIFLYVPTDILSLPNEGMVQAISFRFGYSMSTSKIIFDCAIVLLGVVISLLWVGHLQGVREGTVIAAVCVGLCLRLLQKFFGQYLRLFLGVQESS